MRVNSRLHLSIWLIMAASGCQARATSVGPPLAVIIPPSTMIAGGGEDTYDFLVLLRVNRFGLSDPEYTLSVDQSGVVVFHGISGVISLVEQGLISAQEIHAIRVLIDGSQFFRVYPEHLCAMTHTPTRCLYVCRSGIGEGISFTWPRSRDWNELMLAPGGQSSRADVFMLSQLEDDIEYISGVERWVGP